MDNQSQDYDPRGRYDLVELPADGENGWRIVILLTSLKWQYIDTQIGISS